jgi:hypothetical protein
MNEISKIVSKHNIKMEILASSVFIPDTPSATNIYTIVLKLGRRKLVVPQADRKRKKPSASTVIEALVEDAVNLDRTRTFEGWCIEYGCDIKDDIAQREYQQVVSYTKALKHFLGEKLYQKAVSDWKARYSPLTYKQEEALDN